MKRRADGTIDLSGLDPRVAEEVTTAHERTARRSMTKAQRSREKRHTVSYDIPEDLDNELDRIAADLSVPVSQVARWMLLRGLENTDINELMDARLPSRSMRYQFLLFPPEASPKGKR